MSPTQTTSGRTQAAGCWFLHSGIQDASGGVARYYRADLGRNARISTEITGYAVSCLAFLYQRTGDQQYLAAAQRAAEFLIGQAWHPTLQVFPFEYSANGDAPEPLAYFFDSGIIVRGLLALWQTTGEERFLAAAVRGGESMAAHFAAAATFHPILRLPELTALPYTSQWSRSPGCYQLKSAMAWHHLACASADQRFAELYETALSAALSTHESFLPAETPEKTMDRLHAYLYFLEGLMPAAGSRNIGKTLDIGIRRVALHLREIRDIFERSDVYAQLLRVRLLAEQLAGIPVEQSEATEEAGRIPGFQLDDSRPRLRGGYAFGRRAGAIILHVNPVSTAFCSQALEMWCDYQTGRPLHLQSLV